MAGGHIKMYKQTAAAAKATSATVHPSKNEAGEEGGEEVLLRLSMLPPTGEAVEEARLSHIDSESTSAAVATVKNMWLAEERLERLEDPKRTMNGQR